MGRMARKTKRRFESLLAWLFAAIILGGLLLGIFFLYLEATGVIDVL